jgi:hypothetical protein
MAAVRRRFGALLAAALAVALAGCTLLKLKDEAAAFYASTVLVGRIDGPPGYRGPVIVAATAHNPVAVAHRVLLHEPGGYELIVPQGEYRLAAFGDANGNGRYDSGEPAGEYPGLPVLASGTGVVASLDFALAAAPGPPVRAAARALGAGMTGHSTQAGALAALDAREFAADNGSRGYWAPMEFFKAFGGNIYFLEPYDPARIPILFVHGAAGSPQDWRYFFEHVDRQRYQPWFFYYPSGAALDSMAYLLYWKLLNLQLRYRFDTLVLTAHSMGGLVVRTFLLNHGNEFPQAKLFVSLSTPWAGEASADLGVKHSPAVVPSWRDMQPDGRFMQALFARPLPAGIEHYLLFGHKGGYSMLRPNNDGTVTLASQLRGPAQSEARRVFGFDEDHVSILTSPQVLAQYRSILAAVDQKGGAAPAGQVRVDFSFAGGAAGARGLPGLVLAPVAANGSPRHSVVITLTEHDAGRSVGPIAAGVYDASLVAGSFKTEPRRVRVNIEPGRTPTLSFRLTPQGSLSGYVGADADWVDNPAGSYRPPHPTIRIRSITLAGPGTRRTLVPRGGGGNALERYLDGQDDAVNAFFSFVDLPAGSYELTIDAEGYLPHTSHHSVVPGQPGRLRPIVLTPRS